MQLHPSIPTLELGAVTSLYELLFNLPPDSEVQTGLAIEAQLCRRFFRETP